MTFIVRNEFGTKFANINDARTLYDTLGEAQLVRVYQNGDEEIIDEKHIDELPFDVEVALQ